MDNSYDVPPRLCIQPPLLNSANPWATTLEQLRELYKCPATGAVTTRTALLGQGFPHDESLHQFVFFKAGTHQAVSASEGGVRVGDASLNTLGYSPIPLDEYLEFIRQIGAEEGEGKGAGARKPFIVSVTGTPGEVAECYRRVAEYSMTTATPPLALEINLSCPNIPGKPPPAYDGGALREYIAEVAGADTRVTGKGGPRRRIPWGLKTPPYTHAGQFETLAAALRDAGGGATCPASFVTATNTLGSCLLLGTGELPALPGPGVGGVGGAPLHPLALGNVATLRRLLDAAPQTRHVVILGVGGVTDAAGYRRMRSVGAVAVGVGTALGVRGVKVFGEIEEGLRGAWEV
ncbi:putative dihydroorotate oxidase [Rosellinia necatrix]|uniref:Dihydroorotate dehydrogenase (fumarate) n=1 Tax=Rosellinia necatrix TaxID=77044 RepID=A0A1S8A6J2_ROSNE|nr:putative dihydroorotate oxidase [Rosellinia necatrix]